MRIGEKVIVIDNGETYETYASLFEKMNFKNQTMNDAWKNGEVGTVFGTHGNFIAIRHKDERETLVHMRGLKILSRTELEQEKEELQNRLNEIEETLQSLPTTTLMYCFRRGKHTFVLQPINQKFNLELNGWKEVDTQFIEKIIINS